MVISQFLTNRRIYLDYLSIGQAEDVGGDIAACKITLLGGEVILADGSADDLFVQAMRDWTDEIR